MYKIYKLISPLNNKEVYIGKTKNHIEVRKYQHISVALSHYFNKKPFNANSQKWIVDLHKKGLTPSIELIEECKNDKKARELEMFYIKKYRNNGYNLINMDGNCDSSSKKTISEKQKSQISKTLKYRYNTGEINLQNNKVVKVYNRKGKFITTFPSILKCAAYFNVHDSTITRILNKTYISFRGYQFRYETDNTPVRHITKIKKGFFIKVFNENKVLLGIYTYKELNKKFTLSEITVKKYLKSKKLFKSSVNSKWGKRGLYFELLT